MEDKAHIKKGGFKLYHSITLYKNEEDYRNTWDDWHLIPSSRPVINPPSVKTNIIDIPGAYGALDLSEALTGYPLYSNRTGSIEFIVANGYKSWDILYSEIMSYLHGKRLYLILEDDSSYYYEGRFEVNKWKSDKNWSIITIDYDLHPFKRDVFCTADDWLWDRFDFETGVIQELNEVTVKYGKETAVSLIAGDEKSVIEIKVTTAPDDECKLLLNINNEKTYELKSLSNNAKILITTYVLREGENELVFSQEQDTEKVYTDGKNDYKDAVIAINYRRGVL
ncbi:MAG: hypothetical protein ACI4SS_02615 [Clostridia bacterium]